MPHFPGNSKEISILKSNIIGRVTHVPIQVFIHPLSVLHSVINSNDDLLAFLAQNNKYYTLYTDGSETEVFLRAAV